LLPRPGRGASVFDVAEFAEAEGTPSWMYPLELVCLAYMASKLKAGAKILEIGAWAGSSTLALLSGAGPDRTVHTIDNWCGTDKSYRGDVTGESVRKLFLKNTQSYADAGRLVVFDDDYKNVLPTLERGDYDLIFVDGPHGEEEAAPTVEMVLPLVADMGTLAFHDAAWGWPGVDLMTYGVQQSGVFKKPFKVHSMAVFASKGVPL